MRELADLPNIAEFVRHPFYQQYLAAADPFFPETIEPFAPHVPLFLVPRSGQSAPGDNGLPTFDARFRHMTLPKLRTLQDWGWNIIVCPDTFCDALSFAGGAAERWVLEQLQRR
jgi:hypothetical protein